MGVFICGIIESANTPYLEVRPLLMYLAMLESDSDRQEFLDLYNLYSTPMLLVAKKIFGQDQISAEDAVQTAWMKVIENFSKIQAIPCKKRGAYLVIIVKNEAISILRKRQKELPLNETAAGEESTIENSSQPIMDMIHSMPQVYRAVLEMRFVEECSTREIANRLHLKESTVNTRIHRGRLLLIKKLKEEGYTYD